MAGPGNIIIRVGADASSAIRELRGVNKPLQDVQSRGERMSAGVRRAAVPAAAALTALGVAGFAAAKAAAADQGAQAKLAGALERTAGATKTQVAAAEDFISKMSLATGTADDELRPALAQLASATGNVGTAQSRLKLALDIAAQSGKPLATVTKALAGAEDGRTAALGKLVPGLNKATLESKNMSKITGELADKTGGAAAEAAGTAEGQYKILQVRMAELQEEIGAALLPVIGKLTGLLSAAMDVAARHSGVIKVLAAVVAAVAGAILLANVGLAVYTAYTTIARAVTAAWTATQWLLNAALTANPIGLVVVALVALAAGLVIAYKKSETFRGIVQTALGAVKTAIGAVGTAFGALLTAATAAFDWVRAHWKLALFAFGPLGAIIYLVSTNFDKIKAAASKAFDYLKAVWKAGSFAFGAVEAAVKGVADQFMRVYNWAQDAIGVVRDLLNWIGRIDFPDAPGWLGSLPGLAPAPAAAAAAIGRHPLAAGPRGAPLSAGAGASGFGSGAMNITVNVFGAIDPEGTARTIRRTLRGFERRQGGLAG